MERDREKEREREGETEMERERERERARHSWRDRDPGVGFAHWEGRTSGLNTWKKCLSKSSDNQFAA